MTEAETINEANLLKAAGAPLESWGVEYRSAVAGAQPGLPASSFATATALEFIRARSWKTRALRYVRRSAFAVSVTDVQNSALLSLLDRATAVTASALAYSRVGWPDRYKEAGDGREPPAGHYAAFMAGLGVALLDKGVEEGSLAWIAANRAGASALSLHARQAKRGQSPRAVWTGERPGGLPVRLGVGLRYGRAVSLVDGWLLMPGFGYVRPVAGSLLTGDAYVGKVAEGPPADAARTEYVEFGHVNGRWLMRVVVCAPGAGAEKGDE